ncbi:MAG: hypothetical protein R3B70_14130 [Polyangiaceae bacterium]
MNRRHNAPEAPRNDTAKAPRWKRAASAATGTLCLLTAAFVMLPVGCNSGEGRDASPTGDSKAPPGEPANSTPVARAEADKADEAAIDTEAEYMEMLESLHAKIPRLKEIQKRFEPELFSHAGATSIGIGLDADMETPVFHISVTEPELAHKLPREIEGVRTVIRVSEAPHLLDGGPTCNGGSGPPCHRDPQPLPVEMGNSGAWFQGTACTMGFKACDLESGNSVLVTNSHCAQWKTSCAMAALGDPFQHPGPMDQMPPGSGVNIGNISGHAAPSCGGSWGNFVDATKVESAFFQSSRETRDIGSPKNEIINPAPGVRVQYSGRTTGHNTGTIEALNVTVAVPAAGGFCCGSLTMFDQISFRPKYIIQGGDSGSGVLINMIGIPKIDNRVAGLLFAYDGTVGYFNRIDRVLQELGLTLDFTQCGFPD